MQPFHFYQLLDRFLLDDEGDRLRVRSSAGRGCSDGIDVGPGGGSVRVGCCAAGCGAIGRVAAAPDCWEADRE